MLKVILAGGGTAGHVNPALAISEIIKEAYPDAKFLYVGTPNGIERDLVKKAGIDFAPMEVAGFQRKISVENIKRNVKAAWYLMKSGKRAKTIINEFKPDLVIGTGGYVSGPIVMQAASMGIKTAIHEQNAFPGITTKALAKKVDRVMLTVEKALDYLDCDKTKCTVTGLPVRSGFTAKRIGKAEAKKQLGLDDSVTILSTGGSLGAGIINETAVELLKWYEENGIKVNHIHSYGKNGMASFPAAIEKAGIDTNKPNYIISNYINNMSVCMEAADLIFSRCGAGALTEIEAVGRASILIPSPIVAENHQYHNGMVLVNAGAAIMYEQKDVTPDKIIAEVKKLIDNPEKLDEMAKRASDLYITDTPDRIKAVLCELIQM